VFVNNQKLSEKLPAIFNNISNKGIINLSEHILSKSEEAVLSLGLNFIMKPKDSPNRELLTSFENYARNIRIKFQFVYSNINTVTNSIEQTLRIPNTSFQPHKAGYFVEKYISDARDRLIHQLQQHPVINNRSYQDQNAQTFVNQAVKSLLNDSNLVIKPADKNLGTVLVTRSWYETEALSQLNDLDTYLPVAALPTINSLAEALMSILDKHNRHYTQQHTPNNAGSKHTQTKLAKYVLQFHTTTELSTEGDTTTEQLIQPGKFYMLIKIHKPKICGRPIISSIGTSTYHASKYLDRVLQQVMQALPSYLKNSTQLILLLEQHNTLPADCVQLGADVEALYPSIDLADGLTQLRRALVQHNTAHPNTFDTQYIDFLLDLAEWVLHNNYFEFGTHNYYKQIKGTAMGTPFAVTFAVIYLGMLENEAFEIMKQQNIYTHILLYRRYIDDIYAIFANTSAANSFMSIFNGLRKGIIKLLETHIGDSVVILDLTVFKGERFNKHNKLDTTIYQKPINTYLYLPTSSYHKKSTFKSTIQSEMRRYRIGCSSDTDYNTIVQQFYHRLTARGEGYSANYLQSVMNIQFNRTELLQHCQQQLNNPRDNTHDTTPIVFKTTNTPRQQALTLSKCLAFDEYIWSDPNSSTVLPPNSKPIISYSRAKNLRDTLTKSQHKHTISSPQDIEPLTNSLESTTSEDLVERR